MKDVGLSGIESKLGITSEQAQDVYLCLRDQGLVELRALGGQIELAARGRDAVERALQTSNPIGFRP